MNQKLFMHEKKKNNIQNYYQTAITSKKISGITKIKTFSPVIFRPSTINFKISFVSTCVICSILKYLKNEKQSISKTKKKTILQKRLLGLELQKIYKGLKLS